MIRESLKGLHSDNPEMEKELIYWFCAHNFHYTPDQVDKIPFDRIIYFMELEKKAKEMERDSMKK